MHRHGYKGRKLGRERDQRRALIKGLASSLTMSEKIQTTLPKAKELVPYYEKLITKAKKGDLHNRRQVISKMATVESAHKLVDEIAPKLDSRNSGHLRIVKLENRRGDNAEMAEVSFVDDLKKVNKVKAETKKSSEEKEVKETPKKATKPKAEKATAAKKEKK